MLWRHNPALESQAMIAKSAGINAIARFNHSVGAAGLGHLVSTKSVADAYRSIAAHYGLEIPENGAITEWTDRLCKLMDAQVEHGPDSSSG